MREPVVRADVVEPAERLATALKENAPAGVHWHYEVFPEETHATIYHPAAFQAFRSVFKPVAPRKAT